MRTKLLLIIGILGIVAFSLAAQLNILQAAPQAVPAYPDQRDAARAAAYWMVREFQNDDGGYASFSGGANQAPSSVAGTLDAILAIAAAGYNPAAIFPGESAAPLGFLADNPDDLLDYAMVDGSQSGKVVLALTASAVDPRTFAGHDFAAELIGSLEASGAYGVAAPFKQSVAILGVAAVGEPVPASAVDWLIDRQAADGSWDDGFGTVSNPDATAMAIMALLAAGRLPADPAIQAAVDFLAAGQLADGWEYGSGFGASANTTALVVQALGALGEDWYSAGGPWVVEGQTPLAALLAYQSASGAFQSDFGQGPFDDFYATAQAVPAVTGRFFPLPARYEAARLALSCITAMQDPDSGGWPNFNAADPDAAGTSRAIQAIAAMGEDPQSGRWTTAGGINSAEALEALTPAYLSEGRGGRVGIVMQGVVAAGAPYDVANFAGEDLPLLMSGYLSPTGEYDSTAFGIFAHSEGMLGLLAAEEQVAPQAIDVLLSAQTAGDWGDPDSNGIALQVLGGIPMAARTGTMEALLATQVVDGGWGFGGITSPSSSAEVVQGLTAVGRNPFGPEWSRIVDGRVVNAADAVMAQQGDNGCWPNAFGPGDDPYSTTDAILLLTRQPGWGFSTMNLPVVTAGQVTRN